MVISTQHLMPSSEGSETPQKKDITADGVPQPGMHRWLV